MSDVAVLAEGLGKTFRIGGLRRNYRTLRESIVEGFSKPFRRARDLVRGEAYGAAGLNEEFWALKDVSFEVNRGEAMGIIGHNGAGKSTLLKILSRITEPTSGHADIYGRVGALLEVGTGFHLELTGRENIYLNGAILGMRRTDIDRKFDEIVNFAEVEKFIDTPVKYYSSGMGLRLGFAVAAHMEPEIMVVDEVLAVGDIAFQKKCLGKMQDVASEGRTVLFVSHNLQAIQQLTQRCILLRNGSVEVVGSTNDVIQAYLSLENSISEDGSVNLYEIARSRHIPNPISRRLRILQENIVTYNVPMGSHLTIEVDFDAPNEIQNPDLIIGINDALGYRVANVSMRASGLSTGSMMSGTIRCEIDELMLNQGSYELTLNLKDGARDIERLESVCRLGVSAADVYGTGRLPSRYGLLIVKPRWHYSKTSEAVTS